MKKGHTAQLMLPVPFPVPGDGFWIFQYGRERTVVTDSVCWKVSQNMLFFLIFIFLLVGG